MGLRVRDARDGRRRARRPRDRARLLRRSTREVVDHEGDDPRVDHAARVPRASRPASLGGRGIESEIRNPESQIPGVVTAREEVAQRCETVEQAYEFMLAYAAQGLGGDGGSQSGGQLRELLSRAAAALNGLSAQYATLVEDERPQARDKFAVFLQVLGRDAADALAAIEL